MSAVVDMQDRPFDPTQSGDPKIALRALLDKLESGEIVLHKWMLVYEELSSPTTVTRDTLSSDMTVETAHLLLENAQFEMLQRLRSQ